MKDSPGTFHHYPAVKLLSNVIVGIFCCHSSESKYGRLDSKLEKKMMEIKRSAAGPNNFRSINSIIKKFPKLKEGMKDIEHVFEQYDEDNNGTIDREELKKCLQTLQLTITEQEIDALFYSYDINEKEGIQLNEFIVLLCLTHFLEDSSTSSHTVHLSILSWIFKILNVILSFCKQMWSLWLNFVSDIEFAFTTD